MKGYFEPWFSYGERLWQKEPLEPYTLSQLVEALRHPPAHTLTLIQALRSLYTTDKEEYQQRKRYLPFVLPARFEPPYRHAKNLTYVYGLFADIDHVERLHTTPAALKERLAQDPRVVLIFLSPSGNGLKVFFWLERPIASPSLFKAFYQQFVARWAREHGIEEALDERTCDVARVCFLSYDPDLYLNKRARPVEVPEQIETISTPPTEDNSERPSPSAEEVMDQIRQLLRDEQAHLRRKKQIYVPAIFNQLRPYLKAQLEQMGLVVENIRDIHYGQQFVVLLQSKRGEANLFYGKRGFRAVPSTKSGTDPELNQLLADLLFTLAEKWWQEHEGQ